MKYLIDRASAITPKDSLDDLLKSKNSLRIKLGVDPTAPDVTLGWYAILRALRKFQDYGHTAVLILGEFTAQVADPSAKTETRTQSRAAATSGRAASHLRDPAAAPLLTS